MNELMTLNYKGADLCAIERDDGLWWVLKDVCAVLGIQDHKSVVRRLDNDERGVGQIPTLGGLQEMTIINEPGLYSVILRSDKQEAKDFKRWVTHEVLPTLRHTGTYSMQKPMSPAELLAAQAQLLVQMEQKVAEVEVHTLALEEKVDNAVKVFSRPAQDHWKTDMSQAIKELCQTHKLSIPATTGRMYDELEQAAGCQINARLSRLRTRKRKAGATYREAAALNKLDAVAGDKHLRTIYEGIVRRWQAEYCNK